MAVIALLLCLGALLAAQAPRPASPAASRPAPATRASDLASIKEVMLAIVDPSADALFESVSFDVTTAGIEEKMPRTNEEWLALRASAVLLAEAGHILAVPGRRVEPAKPIRGLESEAPGPEDLPPAEIQRLIDRDRATFNRLARGLADAARVALAAIDARDVNALFASGEDIDRACENCHSRYWYPSGKKTTP